MLEPRPAPALERGVADDAEAEALQQRAARLLVEAERGRERGIDQEARRRGGFLMMIVMIVGVRARLAGDRRRLDARGVRLAREPLGHVDAQPARGAAAEARDAQAHMTAGLLQHRPLWRQSGHDLALLRGEQRGAPAHRLGLQKLVVEDVERADGEAELAELRPLLGAHRLELRLDRGARDGAAAVDQRGEQRAHARRGEEVACRLAHRGERARVARKLLPDENLQSLRNRLHLLRFEPAQRCVDLNRRLNERRPACERRDDMAVPGEAWRGARFADKR